MYIYSEYSVRLRFESGIGRRGRGLMYYQASLQETTFLNSLEKMLFSNNSRLGSNFRQNQAQNIHPFDREPLIEPIFAH